ncbi:MAG: response regulator transcription factor [Chloroflexi bacterium]|nr:MAG: response regulator transcription factor [Chloroflexota bacterium]
MIKILLVEDEPDMLDLTAYVLRRERFVVAEAADGAAALRRWKADRPDIVVLDLGLPSVDGFEVLRRIREESETPVLILTARRNGPDIARAFNLGTDDFLAKPFEFRELIARIRAILRRAKAAQQDVREPKVDANGLLLDPEAYEVTWRDRFCRLTPTEFRILYLLVTNSGHVVSANRLYTYVWGADGGDANALRSHISHLRHKLEVGGAAPGTIASVPAVGYVFRPAPVEQPGASIMNGTATAPLETAPSAEHAPAR